MDECIFRKFALKLVECHPKCAVVVVASLSSALAGCKPPRLCLPLFFDRPKGGGEEEGGESCVAIAFFSAAPPLPSHAPSRSVFGTAESLMRPLSRRTEEPSLAHTRRMKARTMGKGNPNPSLPSFGKRANCRFFASEEKKVFLKVLAR